MKYCNHPNCNKGVMVETTGSITQFKQCPYCVRDNNDLESHLMELRMHRMEAQRLLEV